jgi:hypothetical protein
MAMVLRYLWWQAYQVAIADGYNFHRKGILVVVFSTVGVMRHELLVMSKPGWYNTLERTPTQRCKPHSIAY